MTDPLDIASEREQIARDDALDAQRRRAGLTGKTAADSAAFCLAEDCGTAIPEARRQAAPGCRFCIDCQQLQERKQ